MVSIGAEWCGVMLWCGTLKVVRGGEEWIVSRWGYDWGSRERGLCQRRGKVVGAKRESKCRMTEVCG